MQVITQTRRVTSCFLQAIPPQVKHFDAYMYAIVPRKQNKVLQDTELGTEARIDPCVYNWDTQMITMTLPSEFNPGIESFDDLDPQFYESIEAAFISLMRNCL